MPMARDAYRAQVALLVRLLPFIAAEPVFALKGGTAINLFYRDMPRLSVADAGMDGPGKVSADDSDKRPRDQIQSLLQSLSYLRAGSRR
jgi:hypothetical protein